MKPTKPAGGARGRNGHQLAVLKRATKNSGGVNASGNDPRRDGLVAWVSRSNSKNEQIGHIKPWQGETSNAFRKDLEEHGLSRETDFAPILMSIAMLTAAPG